MLVFYISCFYFINVYSLNDMIYEIIHYMVMMIQQCEALINEIHTIHTHHLQSCCFIYCYERKVVGPPPLLFSSISSPSISFPHNGFHTRVHFVNFTVINKIV